jgi:hypothetical protein
MDFDDLELHVRDDILAEHSEPAAISAEVAKLLHGLGAAHVFAVKRLAQGFAAAIASEHARRDGDMVDVIQRQSAVLEPLKAWLDRYGMICGI